MITKNIQIVTESIGGICNTCERKIDELTIIAVSKTKPVSDIETAYEAGIRNFGENKAQDLRDKNTMIDLDINWHFIGRLQRNKVKYVVNAAEYIHSLDSFELAMEINNKAIEYNKVQKVLVEVNTSGERTKFGLQDFESLYRLIEKCDVLTNIEVKGLMTMAPYTDNEVIVRKSFRLLREMKEKLIKSRSNISELSMGMTNDYKIAIEEGSTMLRIGTAIFSERDTSNNWREI